MTGDRELPEKANPKRAGRHIKKIRQLRIKAKLMQEQHAKSEKA